MIAPSTYLAWEANRGTIVCDNAPSGQGDPSVLVEQFLVGKSTKCQVAKGAVSKDPALARHCVGFVDPGALLIVHPGAESKMNELIRPKSTVQLPLFIGA